MIPIALVAGFLGAGKTTFLTSYARRAAPRRVAFIVNEFAATDVDTPLLGAACDDVVGISGGSIFCRCKVTDFINALSTLPARFPHADGVVIEASGMADPSAMQSMLDEAGLSSRFSYAGTVTLVDPTTLPKVLDTMPAAERQVAAADVVVITKTDLHPATAIAATIDVVRSINTTARIIHAAHGACNLDPLALRQPRWVDGAVLPCSSQSLVAVELPCPHPIDVNALATDIAALGNGLLRAKGFVCDRDGWRFLDWSAGRMRVDACPPGPPGVALIVQPQIREQAAAIAMRLAAGGFTA